MADPPPQGMPDSKEIPDSSAQAGAESPPAVSPEPAAEDLDAAAAGDAAAFARLYMALQPRLSRYASSLVGQDADEVTAEAWLQIARDLHGFTGTVDAFRAWTARIVRNRAMDHLRAPARRPVQSAPIDELFDVAATDDTAVGAIDRLSTAGALALIRSLPRDQAEAVLLRAVVGLDAKSAGQVLGKSAAAVRVASHRGLKTLAKRVRIDDAKPRP